MVQIKITIFKIANPVIEADIALTNHLINIVQIRTKVLWFLHYYKIINVAHVTSQADHFYQEETCIYMHLHVGKLRMVVN